MQVLLVKRRVLEDVRRTYLNRDIKINEDPYGDPYEELMQFLEEIVPRWEQIESSSGISYLNMIIGYSTACAQLCAKYPDRVGALYERYGQKGSI